MALPDRYRLARRIAQGGMADVWCAEDAVLGRNVAVKLLAERFLHDPPAIRRFMREARAAARLSAHQHVATIFDVSQSRPFRHSAGERPFIVMEYLAGGTVADALRVGAVGREEAVRWVREAAAAIDYAHGRGVVHRDIKPGNLLLDTDRVLHVADFGIARLGTEDTITSSGELFGTAAYISPEQAVGQPATEASDRYSLAVVAFELLTGSRPFAARNFAAQARQHVEDDPPRASSVGEGLPRSVDRVLAQGMAKRPEERWPTAASFADALEAAVLDDPRTTRVLPAVAGLRPRRGAGAVGSHPRAIAIGALAAVAFGVGVAAGANSGGPAVRAGRVAQASPRAATGTHPVLAAKPRPRPTEKAPSTTVPAGLATSAPPTPGADALEAQGHQLMLGGDYNGAVGVLRKAVATADPSSLTYAYALFDLGRSLRLAGDPQQAAVVLQRRLEIPNQTEVVRQELQLALRSIGAQVNSSGGGSAYGASYGSGAVPQVSGDQNGGGRHAGHGDHGQQGGD